MTCTTCSANVPSDASQCGSCGSRPSKRRDSLTGVLFDGRYQTGAKLAAGGFGAIYRAKDVRTGAAVALKVLHPDLASDAHLSARFRREAAVLASLRNPHTIRTFAHGQAADGTLYIVMELLTGRSLHAELRAQGPLPWWRMLAIMRGVCSSLIEAHSLGFVHRDLKPANIHLEERSGTSDFVKVLDFGIVKVRRGSDAEQALDDEDSDITRVGQAIGTLEYMAPEQIIGGETDHRTDLYTLGVVAYEMITGRRPFDDAGGATGLMTALMTRTPVPLSSMFHRDCFPAVVDRLILRCLASDPQDRFADARELADAIDDILITASPAAIGMNSTLPGTGPFAPRLPARRVPSFVLPAVAAPQAAAPAFAGTAPAFAAAVPSLVAAAPAVSFAALSRTVPPPSPLPPSPSAPSSSAPSPSAVTTLPWLPPPPPPPRSPPLPPSPPPRSPTLPPSPSLSPTLSPTLSLSLSSLSFSGPLSGSLSAFDDGDLTTVDVVPLFDAAWEPGTERSISRLARTPHLDDPPPPPSFEAARGSTVRVSPVHVHVHVASQPAPARFATLKLAAWAAALLAGGVGLGMAVVSLMA